MQSTQCTPQTGNLTLLLIWVNSIREVDVYSQALQGLPCMSHTGDAYYFEPESFFSDTVMNINSSSLWLNLFYHSDVYGRFPQRRSFDHQRCLILLSPISWAVVYTFLIHRPDKTIYLSYKCRQNINILH